MKLNYASGLKHHVFKVISQYIYVNKSEFPFDTKSMVSNVSALSDISIDPILSIREHLGHSQVSR